MKPSEGRGGERSSGAPHRFTGTCSLPVHVCLPNVNTVALALRHFIGLMVAKNNPGLITNHSPKKIFYFNTIYGRSITLCLFMRF